MNRFFSLFAVLVSFVLSACAFDSDTPTPTPEKTGKVAVPPAPPSIIPPVSTTPSPPIDMPKATYCSSSGWSLHPYDFQGCCGSFEHPKNVLPTMLVKGSKPTVYYLGSNSKRYVFPSTTTLASWYCPLSSDGTPLTSPEICQICQTVKEFSDVTLEGINVGGVVTFRPGTYLTGITSDSKRFVISRGKVLHWIADDAVAIKLFGPAYDTTRVRLIADLIFVSYNQVGRSVERLEDYDLIKELRTTIEEDLGIVP